MSHIYLIRHAHAAWSEDEMRPLSPQGWHAAECVAQLLATIEMGAIFTSPYLRARQTIEPLAARLGVPVVEDIDLRERTLGTPPNNFLSDVEATWSDFDLCHDGGESNRAAQIRLLRSWRRITRRLAGRNGVIATHGNALALLLHSFDSCIGFKFWQSLTLPDIYRVDVGHDGSIRRYERVWGE